jgi:hypothetical protein
VLGDAGDRQQLGDTADGQQQPVVAHGPAMSLEGG